MGAAEQKARSPIVQDLVLGVEDGEHWRGDGNVWIQFLPYISSILIKCL